MRQTENDRAGQAPRKPGRDRLGRRGLRPNRSLPGFLGAWPARSFSVYHRSFSQEEVTKEVLTGWIKQTLNVPQRLHVKEVDRDLVSFELLIEFGEVLYEMYWVYKIVHRAPCPKRERMTHDAGRVFSNVRKLCRCCCFTHSV